MTAHLENLGSILPRIPEGTEVEIIQRVGGGVVVMVKGHKWPLKVPARCVIEDEPENCPTCGQSVAVKGERI